MLLGELVPAAASSPSRPASLTLSAARLFLASLQTGDAQKRDRLPLYLTVKELLTHGGDEDALLEAALGTAHVGTLREYATERLAADRCTLAVDGLGQPLDEGGLRLLLLRLRALSERHPKLPVVVSYDAGGNEAPVHYPEPCGTHDHPCWVRALAWTRAEQTAAFRHYSPLPGNEEGRRLTRFVYGFLHDRDAALELVSRELTAQWEAGFRTFDPGRYTGTQCPFKNWLYTLIRRAAIKEAGTAPPPPPPPPEPTHAVLAALAAALDEDFLGTAWRLGDVCIALRREGDRFDEPELAPVIDYLSNVLGQHLDDGRGSHREAAGIALAKMGVATSLWYPRLNALSRETMTLCLYREPPLEPTEATKETARPCTPVAMRQRLFQALQRLAERLRTAKAPR